MAGLSSFQNPKTLGTNLLFDDDADATSANNVDDGATTVRSVLVDNAGLAAIVYVQLKDSGAFVPGTDGPDYQWPVALSVEEEAVFLEDGDYAGARLTTGLCYAVTTDSCGNAAPGVPPNVYFTLASGEE